MIKRLSLAVMASVALFAQAETPAPYYFFDFEDGLNGATIVGAGEVADDDFGGKVFQNAKGGMRANYLRLPNDVFAKAGANNEFSVAMWVSAKNAGESADYAWCPLFTAYNEQRNIDTPDGNTWPMFACQYRGLLQVNSGETETPGWCDYTDAQHENGVNVMRHFDTDVLADKDWHFYTAVLTKTTGTVYYDGVKINSWNINGTDDGHLCNIFGNAGYDLFCVGGNQAWNWGDPDPAFAFDDVALYDKALTPENISEIMTAKKEANSAVEKIAAEEEEGAYFNLQGIKVANPSNGLYIRNGKKVIVK